MDPVRNPFAPGAGNPPPELAGRSDVLSTIDISLQRVAIGRSTQGSILVGLRGVGKTVLLVKSKEIAEAQGYQTLAVEAHEGKTLAELIVPGLQSSLYSLSRIENAKDKARKGLRNFKNFINGVKINISDVDFGLSIDAEAGSADSGKIETDLPNLIFAVGEAARAANRPFVFLIDEMQYLAETEFSALIMSIHRINQSGLPVLLIGAGLPQIIGLAGQSKSYAERLFKYPPIGALKEEDARTAIVKPVHAEHADITDAAVDLILEVTERYPYYIQQWAHDSWNIAPAGVIRQEDVASAGEISIKALDDNFFRVRFDRCTPSEKKYMRALADFGPGTHKSGDVSTKLGVKAQSVGPVRSSLIKKGMIYSPQHGDTAFTVPLFDAYMRRVM